MLQQWCIGATAVFLLWGSASFLGQREPQRLYGLFFGFLLTWGYVGAFHLSGGLQVFLPPLALLAGASFWTAWSHVRMRRTRAFVGASLLAAGFLIWGLFLIAFAVLQFDPYQVSSLYFLSGVVQMFLAVSMIVLTLEESRDRLQALEREASAHEDEKEELSQALEGKATALQASESRFRTLAEAAPVGIMEADSDGRIVFANRRWRELVSEPEASGVVVASWADCAGAEDRDRVRELWARSMGVEEPFASEFKTLDWRRGALGVGAVHTPVRLPRAGGRVVGHPGRYPRTEGSGSPTAIAGGPVATIAENGDVGHAGGRSGSWLQQPVATDHGICPAGAGFARNGA